MSIFDGMAEIFRDTLGEDVVYTHAGSCVSLQGIVEMPAVLADGLSGEGLDTVETQISVSFAVADLPSGYATRDTVQFRGKAYIVKAVLPDGRGMVRLPLERARLDSGGYLYIDGESPAELLAAMAEIDRILVEDLWTV